MLKKCLYVQDDVHKGTFIFGAKRKSYSLFRNSSIFFCVQGSKEKDKSVAKTKAIPQFFNQRKSCISVTPLLTIVSTKERIPDRINIFRIRLM